MSEIVQIVGWALTIGTVLGALGCAVSLLKQVDWRYF
jgi:hypothetical protein